MPTYSERREQLEEYFDRTAIEAWAALTTDAPVSRIRATVRAGRNRMRETLVGYLPQDMHGQRLLDAGCGTGALAEIAAKRGAEVVAVDVSPKLIGLARERIVLGPEHGTIDFRVGDMRAVDHGEFDWVIAMDSFIHYQPADIVATVAELAARTRRGLAFTFAPSTALISIMHAVGKAFPRRDRAPDIIPVAERTLRELIAAHDGLEAFEVTRSERVEGGFYKSQSMELVRR
jgi:magnesium-protoporphyrin O-methyltransferase